MIISILVAASQNNVIGINNKLPWHLPADMKYFKNLTIGHHVIMGRKTFDALGKPLKERTNVIITRQEDLKIDGAVIVNDLKAVFDFCRSNGETECFVIGGGDIIRQAITWADKIYLTTIYQNFDGDTFLTPINKEDWKEVKNEKHEPDEKNKYSYAFRVFERKKN
jgi:dihydrofolate reductase